MFVRIDGGVPRHFLEVLPGFLGDVDVNGTIDMSAHPHRADETRAEVTPFLVSEKTAARLIGVSYGMLVAARFKRQPLLPFVRLGSRTIRYRVADIESMIRDRAHCPSMPHRATTPPFTPNA
jgi:hypothetical protein